MSPLLFAVIALLIGKKTGWDLYNYHWYNPYAWLTDRFFLDVGVAHHATYYNPLSDVPLYLIGAHGSAWLGGAYMGALAGFSVALIAVIAHRVLPGEMSTRRIWLLGAIAALAVTGAGAFQEIGDIANDIPAALGTYAALAILLHWLAMPDASSWRLPFVAGLLAGAFVALKLTTAVYAFGALGALLFAGGSLRRRLQSCMSCGIGMALGLVCVGGLWLHKLWVFSGNPFFPYFNDVFHSPLLLDENYRDLNFRPKDWLSALVYPWRFTVESTTVSESIFRDARILIVYLLAPLTLAVRAIFKRRANVAALSPEFRLLIAFATLSYAAWLALFGIYRYLIPLEMLAPLLIVSLVSLWPIDRRWQLAIAAALLLFAQLFVKIDISDRQSWVGPYVAVTVPSVPDSAMILMTGHAPMSYVIPYFPRNVPFVRIDSWLISAKDRKSGLALAMRERVERHAGPLFVLFEEKELVLARDAARAYGLALQDDSDACRQVRSTINQPLWLCAANRSST